MNNMVKNKIEQYFFRSIVYAAAIATISVVLGITAYILVKGIPNISLDLFALRYTSDNASVNPGLINTLTIVALAILIAAPVGIFSAIYLVEYASKNNKLVKVVRTTAETLTGIPSIVYGLFGLLMFVDFLGMGYSLMAGALTVSIMVLPVIMRTTEEALLSVPDSFREGSYGLGAGKLRTVFKIILPSAIPGILSGIILSIGRIVGETAALIYTAGSVAQIPDGVFGSGRTLSVHLYALWNEGLEMEKAYATAVILLVIVAVINEVSVLVAKKLKSKYC